MFYAMLSKTTSCFTSCQAPKVLVFRVDRANRVEKFAQIGHQTVRIKILFYLLC